MEPSPSKRTLPNTKTEYTIEYLRSSLLRGDIRPGDPLSISSIAEELGISATPVREAIKVLQAQGLVTQEPHKTGKVASIPLSDADELYQIRARLEGLAAGLAASRADDGLLEDLGDLQERMTLALNQEDSEEFSALNTDWHFRVYNATETRWLREFIVRLWVQVPWRRMWDVSVRHTESLTQHNHIMGALQRGESAEAERLMREHVMSGLETLRRLMSEPDS